MKKRLVLGVITLGTASMLCGFDSAETADTLIDKMNEASADLTSLTADIDMNVDAAVNISDGTTNSSIGISLTGSETVAASLDPFAAEITASLNFAALGSSQAIEEEIYMVTDENDALKLYTKSTDAGTGESSWSVDTMDDFNINDLVKLSTATSVSATDMADWGMELVLAPEAADVNGTECYLLTTSIDTDTLSTILSKLSDLTGEDMLADEDISTALAMLQGLKIDMEYYVDAATYLPIKLHMDMNDSDLTTVNTLLNSYITYSESDEAPSSTAELQLNDLSLDAVYDYTTPVSVTVPDEALEAEASGNTDSLSDLAEDAASSVTEG
jgi:hypothetical protein